MTSTQSPADPGYWFQLGLARERAQGPRAALDAYLQAFRLAPGDPRIALFAGAALAAVGRTEDAVTVFSIGDDTDPNMRRLANREGVSPEVKARSQLADKLMREHFTRLHGLAVEEARRMLRAQLGEVDLSRVGAGIWPQTHDRKFEYRTPKQAPDIFYMPDLPARTITPRSMLAWASAVEAATEIVLEEYEAVIGGGVQMSPYVHPRTQSPIWRELRGNMDWSSLHLYSRAEETPFAKFFPRTLEALKAGDVVRVNGGTPIEMFFSRLKAGAHIPPHFGAANNRITVHLPLITPEGCTIRVAEDVHAWRKGELFAFDDSFEHEAWNRSDEERVVLIFEAHHPDLTEAERRAIEHCFAAREAWRSARRLP